MTLNRNLFAFRYLYRRINNLIGLYCNRCSYIGIVGVRAYDIVGSWFYFVKHENTIILVVGHVCFYYSTISFFKRNSCSINRFILVVGILVTIIISVRESSISITQHAVDVASTHCFSATKIVTESFCISDTFNSASVSIHCTVASWLIGVEISFSQKSWYGMTKNAVSLSSPR